MGGICGRLGVMKRIIFTLLLMAVGGILSFNLGCEGMGAGGGRGMGVEVQGEHEYMFVAGDGDKGWWSALELERLAKEYARRESIAFDFTNTKTKIWIATDGKKELAKVHFYGPGLEDPFLDVRVSREGRVLEHYLGPEKCPSCPK